MASQLPRDVEAKIKGTVVGIEGGLESAASRKLLAAIKRELNDHGHALDKGNRDIERIEKVAIVSEQIEKLAPFPNQANMDPSVSCKEEGWDDLSEKSVSYVQRGRYQRGDHLERDPFQDNPVFYMRRQSFLAFLSK